MCTITFIRGFCDTFFAQFVLRFFSQLYKRANTLIRYLINHAIISVLKNISMVTNLYKR